MSTWKTAGSIPQDTSGFGDPTSDPRYTELLKKLQLIHADLLKTNLSIENSVLIVDRLGELRLSANQLFAFMNYYIDALSDLELDYANKRKTLFLEKVKEPTGSIGKAESFARESLRVEEAEIKVVQNRIKQIQNEYDRYNGIAMYLHARMKENQSEKYMG